MIWTRWDFPIMPILPHHDRQQTLFQRFSWDPRGQATISSSVGSRQVKYLRKQHLGLYSWKGAQLTRKMGLNRLNKQTSIRSPVISWRFLNFPFSSSSKPNHKAIFIPHLHVQALSRSQWGGLSAWKSLGSGSERPKIRISWTWDCSDAWSWIIQQVLLGHKIFWEMELHWGSNIMFFE